jgi:hypothetical protein
MYTLGVLRSRQASNQTDRQTNKQTNSLYAAQSTVLEKLSVPLIVNKFQHFMDTERSAPLLQVFGTCPCSEPYKSRRSSRPTSWIYILILSFLLYLCLPSGLVPLRLPTKTLHAPFIFPYMLHAQPISFFVI